MLVSKSNGHNVNTVLGSGSCNENNSSNPMELLAYSIINLICKEAASGMYRGALETLQKIMSECISRRQRLCHYGSWRTIKTY